MNKFNPFESFMKYMKRDFTTFDMSNFVQTSQNLGELNPVRTDFVLPSDFWHGNASAAVMLPPLTAPAFTRINGLLQSFYVSFPSIWKYWNQFISDRPSDAYLNSANLSKFKGMYQEPCIPMFYVQLICKIYYGYIAYFPYDNTLWSPFFTNYQNISSTPYVTYTFSEIDGYRRYVANRDNDKKTNGSFVLGYEGDAIFLFRSGDGTSLLNNDAFARSVGFYDYFSFIYHQIGQCVRFFKNNGLPVELIASSSFDVYRHEVINALPFIAQSKVWNEYYRNPTVQGCELNYFEINGLLCDVFEFTGSEYQRVNFEGITQTSWQIRLSDIPFNYQSKTYIDLHLPDPTISGSNSLFDFSTPLAVLTGIGLRRIVLNGVASVNDSFVALLPNYYNGLCVTKYRNFENDYFTSAAPDPMMGRSSISVPGTLEELRTASKLEEFLESNTAARNFFDFLKHHFGTTAKSVLYERPEFLGSSKVAVNISENIQTSSSVEGSPLGTRGGVASAFEGNKSLVSRNFEEHGLVITYLSFIIDSQYFQGLPIEFLHHKDYLDLPWPEFANLGLESIKNSEIFYGRLDDPADFYSIQDNLAVAHADPGDFPSVTPNATTGTGNSINQVFGFTPRYSKYKFKPDRLSGAFTDSLSFWNTFRFFRNTPKLSHNFISYENAVWMSNLDRIFNFRDELGDKFQVDLYLDYSVSRCLPLVSNPTLN